MGRKLLRFSRKFNFAQAINELHHQGFTRVILFNDPDISTDGEMHAIRLDGSEELVLLQLVKASLWDCPAVIEYEPGKFKEIEKAAKIYVKIRKQAGFSAMAFKDRLKV